MLRGGVELAWDGVWLAMSLGGGRGHSEKFTKEADAMLLFDKNLLAPIYSLQKYTKQYLTENILALRLKKNVPLMIGLVGKELRRMR